MKPLNRKIRPRLVRNNRITRKQNTLSPQQIRRRQVLSLQNSKRRSTHRPLNQQQINRRKRVVPTNPLGTVNRPSSAQLNRRRQLGRNSRVKQPIRRAPKQSPRLKFMHKNELIHYAPKNDLNTWHKIISQLPSDYVIPDPSLISLEFK